MSKFFDSNESVKDLALAKFEEVGLGQLGLDLEVISITKANSVISVTKASAITEFRTHGDGTTIHMIVYEEAFDRLSDTQKAILMEGAISNIAYDTEKDKVMIDNSKYGEFFRMRGKYENYGDILEIAQAAIDQIAEEEKQRKQAEREAKKGNKNG